MWLRNLKMRFVRRRYSLKHVHPTFYLAGRSSLSPDLYAGAYSFIGENCRIYPKVSIGAYTMLAPEVSIVGADHRFDLAGVPMIFAGRPGLPNTVIEEDVWIGFRSTIMCGVTIGRGAIIAANSVVTKNVPPYEVYGGVPARKLKDRFPDSSMMKTHDDMLAGPIYVGKFCDSMETS